MNDTARISHRGKSKLVRTQTVDGIQVVVTGRLVRVAMIFDEDWQDGEPIADPAAFISRLREQNVRADIFTFAQKLPRTDLAFASLHYQMTNLAVAPTVDFKDWWEHRLPQETRKHVRKSQKLNLVVRETTFDDKLVHGLKAIYDEAPVRQGRRFWHYGKPFEVVKAENSTYLGRSLLIGAYLGDELVGLLKLVRVGSAAQVMQLIAKSAHADKKTTNALLAKGVELCASRGIAQLVYGQYFYGKNHTSSLTEFKRRNGFEMVLLPRYFVPITVWGRLCVRAGLHRPLREMLPERVERWLLNLRAQSFRWMDALQFR
jgi:hypothetical protein